MLLLVKVEIKRCIDRLEVVQGFHGFGRGVGCVKGENVESKSKPNERTPTNQFDALGLNISGPSIVVQPKGACVIGSSPSCVV